MPIFGFFRKPAAKAAAAVPGSGPDEAGMPFDCCTEDWRIRGRVPATGRLLDSMNRREALEITGAEWAPLDGSAEFQAVPGLKSIDPYDVLVVFATASTMPSRSPEASAAHRRSKEMYDVALEVPPFHVVGTVHLYPGLEPATLLDHATNLFVAVTGAVVLLEGSRVGPDVPTTILVNRSYITRVHQVEDARRHQDGGTIVAAEEVVAETSAASAGADTPEEAALDAEPAPGEPAPGAAVAQPGPGLASDASTGGEAVGTTAPGTV